MPTTAARLKEQVRDRLDEPAARQWTDRQLYSWANEGMKDMARRGRMLQDTVTVNTTANTAEYTLGSTVLEIHQGYWSRTGLSSPQPITFKPFGAMDNVWFGSRDDARNDPVYATAWGYAPNLKMRLWPTPTVNGTVQLFVCRLPTDLDITGANENVATVDLPEGWVDTLVDYVEWCALRKDRDPRWQEAKALYEQKLDELIGSRDAIAANHEITFDSRGSSLPDWLTTPDWGWY